MIDTQMQFSLDEIQRVCRLVNELTGIQWDADKTYLIESRFGKLMHDHRIESLTELVRQVQSSHAIRTDFIDSVTTRETLFFRDDGPFNALRHKALPEIIDAKSDTAHPRRLRIWSAACSSGQEPYSIGIILRELLEDIDDWDIKILATDLAPAALASASLGVYSDFEMSRGVPENIRNKYFIKVAAGWKICDEVRSLVCFETRNLLEPFTNMGPFDVIFCRNVAIYFDEPVKRDLFDRLADVLAPHGSIFIGSSETLNSFGERWKPQFHCRGTFYQPNRSNAYVPARAAQKMPPSTAQPPRRPTLPASVAAARRPAPASVAKTPPASPPTSTALTLRRTTALTKIKPEVTPVKTRTPPSPAVSVAKKTTLPMSSAATKLRTTVNARPARPISTTTSTPATKTDTAGTIPGKNSAGAVARIQYTSAPARSGLAATTRSIGATTTGSSTTLSRQTSSVTSKIAIPPVRSTPTSTKRAHAGLSSGASTRSTNTAKSTTPADDLLVKTTANAVRKTTLPAAGSCRTISSLLAQPSKPRTQATLPAIGKKTPVVAIKAR